MKKAIIIGVVLLIGGFFAFFNLEIKETNKLQFLENYKSQIVFADYEAERVLSTNQNEDGILITFNKCKIDTTNMKLFGAISKDMAIEINTELNSNNQYKNITLIFKPDNQDGIVMDEFMSLEELQFIYPTSELLKYLP